MSDKQDTIQKLKDVLLTLEVEIPDVSIEVDDKLADAVNAINDAIGMMQDE